MTDTEINTGTTYACAAGYYCTLEAKQTNPTSAGLGGGQCSAGHYCPQGTSSPIPCPPGTYRNPPGASLSTECLACPAGNYCEGYGKDTYTVCDEGWFCEITGLLGESSPTPVDSTGASKICPVGFRCTGGNKYACSGNY